MNDQASGRLMPYLITTTDGCATCLGALQGAEDAYACPGCGDEWHIETVEHQHAVATLGEASIDLGGPSGGRYWIVVSGHPVEPDGDAHAAAVYARATGSVGATYYGVRVARLDAPLSEEGGAVGPLSDGTMVEVWHATRKQLLDAIGFSFHHPRLSDDRWPWSTEDIVAAYNDAVGAAR